jgi:protein-S-isoprenylcysteine O-methyltransferase Ste14
VPLPLLGMVLAALAFIPPVWAFILFRREDTEINPTSLVNRKLVTRGPYQFTRNPMYLGLVTLSLGIAVWIGAWPMFMAPLAAFATFNWGLLARCG